MTKIDKSQDRLEVQKTYVDDLEANGFCVVDDVLAIEEVSEIRKKLLAAAKKKKKTTKKKGAKPTNPALYARVKAEAKRKFKVYPSAYANAWLVRTYKKRGGTYA